MKEIEMITKSKSYPVIIGNHAIYQLKEFIQKKFPIVTKILIITDGNVGNRYLHILMAELEPFKPLSYVVPNGEKAKTFDVFYECQSFALENKLDRKSLIIAFGGGAVGDLAGFVAATFMRGIPFIQVPTTILAHDSAVGGKVAINHPLGKNMIGAFYQPEAVFYDLQFLQSLPLQEIRSGFSEVVKHALIRDESFFAELHQSITNLQSIPDITLTTMLEKGIQIKGDIVKEDEKEEGIRAYLNFGHTLGHAIEGEMGYGNITHGEAVMIGIVFAMKLSEKLLQLSFPMEDFMKWLKTLGYKTNIPNHLSYESLIQRMKQDKKAFGGSIQFVLLEQIGKPTLKTVNEKLILETLLQL